MDLSGENENSPPHFTYIWTIENVSEAIPALTSPTFTVKQMEMTKWDLILCTATPEDIVIDFRRAKEDDGPRDIKIRFEISFLGIDGLPLIERVEEESFERQNFFEFQEFADKQEVFVRRKTEFLPKEALTIRCRMWRTGTEIAKNDLCFARTRLQPDRHSFVWAIRDFSTLQRDQVRKIILRKSPTRVLSLNLSLTENGDEEYVEISLKYSVINWLTAKIGLLDSAGQVVHSSEKCGRSDRILTFQNFFERSRLINDEATLLPNDVMYLRCEIEMNAKMVWSRIENYPYLNSNFSNVTVLDVPETLHLDGDERSGETSSSFVEAMESLIGEGTFSDVILRTDSKSLPAHKCILSARSPVFREMFAGGSKWEICKRVQIPGVDEKAFRQLLSYIYTDRVGDLDCKRALDLNRTAHKYGLLDLKRRCATFLMSDLSVNSACAILSAQDMQDTELREAARNFVLKQGEEFFETDMWKGFKAENSWLAANILGELLIDIKI